MFKKRVFIFVLLFTYFTAIGYPASQLIVEPGQGTAPFVRAINQAHKQIKLVMYGFTNRALRDALIAAQKRGVQIQVILQYAPYKSAGENDFTIKLLKHHHIAVKDSNPAFRLTHQKTLIIDNKIAWIMTLNFTHSAFSKQRNYAVEITGPRAVNEIQQYFLADWQRKPAPTQRQLVWSPYNTRQTLLSLIKQAKHYINIEALALSDYQLIGALAKAAKRGVNVQIIMTKKFSKPYRRKLQYLQRYGATIRLNKQPWMHAKVLLIDPKTRAQAYIGSANFTAPAFDNNRELGVIVKNPALLQKLQQTFTQDWHQA